MAQKALVVYYSRTGTTKKVAQAVAETLKCDIEEIVDTKDRSGVLGFVRSGKDAMLRKLTVLREPQKDAAAYDLVIIGTPVWAWTVSTPVRTYISRYADKFHSVAFFATTGGTGFERTFRHMKEVCGRKPVALLGLRMDEVVKADATERVKAFVARLAG